jgi:DNA-binding XRE family transcriptional regulator
MDNTTSYGNWVRLVKETAGLSNVTMARKIGVNRATIVRWVMGQSCPHPLYARILAYMAKDYRLPAPPVCEVDKEPRVA